jgi:anti-sigma regulatory factor (Ser/Thr protein kinase)
VNKETEAAVMALEPSTPASEFGFSALFATTERGSHTVRLSAERALARYLPQGSDTFDAARLIIGELTANAALYGRVRGRKARLDLALEPGCLLVEVTDARGERLPAPRPSGGDGVGDGDGERGRGLLLVEALADGWGWRPHHPGGKTVWAVLTLRTE